MSQKDMETSQKIKERSRLQREKERRLKTVSPKKGEKPSGRKWIILGSTVGGIALFLAAFLIFFHVQTIKVVGNEYCSEAQVKKWMKEDGGVGNSLYLVWKYRGKRDGIAPFLDDISVSLDAPWEVRVKVYEKNVVAYIQVDGENVYFDKDGVVLVQTALGKEGIPLVEGLVPKDVQLYQKLNTDNPDIFGGILELTQSLKKIGFTPDRILYEEEQVYLYFGNICVNLGKTDYRVKIDRLATIFEKLEGQTGTVHMETLNKDSRMIRFEKDVVPHQAKEEESEEEAKEETEEEVEYEELEDDSEIEDYSEESQYQNQEGHGENIQNIQISDDWAQNEEE